MKKRIQNTGENFTKYSQPHTTFTSINWQDKIVSLGISSSGNEGVIFIQTTKGSIVFKPTNQVSTDIFLNNFAKMLGLNVPKIRSISYDSVEFKQMMKAIERYCHQDEPLYRRVRARLDRPYYQILEYIQGVTLASVGPERFDLIFNQEENLVNLGRLISFDMIVNNSDRLFLYWDNEGNIDNLIISIEKVNKAVTIEEIESRNNLDKILFKKLITIDTRHTIVDIKNKYAAKNFEDMLTRFKQFIKNVIKFLQSLDDEQHFQNQQLQIEQAQQFKNLNQQFLLYTQRIFTYQQLKTISYSLICSLDNFANTIGIQSIKNLINSLKKSGDDEWVINYWNHSLEKLHLQYFEEIIKTIQNLWVIYKPIVDKILQTKVQIKIQQPLQNKQNQLLNQEKQPKNEELKNSQIKIEQNAQEDMHQNLKQSNTNQNNEVHETKFNYTRDQIDENLKKKLPKMVVASRMKTRNQYISQPQRIDLNKELKSFQKQPLNINKTRLQQKLKQFQEKNH